MALLSGCTVGPDWVPPAPLTPQVGYGAQTGKAVALGEAPDRDWWRAFRSPELNDLVDRAIAGNHSLAQSRATLKRAHARIAAVTGHSLPQVDASARAEYERINLSAFGLSSGESTFAVKNPTFDLYTIGGGVSYDLDLFGRNRRAVEQVTAEAEASMRATEAAHLLIAGRVVQQVIAIAAANDRLATQQALIAEDERNLALTNSRQRAGEGTMVEVLSAKDQLADDRARIPMLEQELAEGRIMLALLLGITPAELGKTGFSLNTFALPPSVPVALPSALVHNRPDILEAEAQIHAANASLGIATANLYPDIAIGASFSQSNSALGKLFESGSNGFDLFSGITAPIFHGGTLKAEKRAAEADVMAAQANYRQVVVEAFGQVATLLSSVETDGRSLSAREESAAIAAQSLKLSRRSFEVGNSGILQVLDASRSFQRSQLTLLEVRNRQLQNIARLYVATAGGWLEQPQS